MTSKGFTTALLALGLGACGDGGDAPLVAEEILRLNSEANQVVIGLDHYVTSEGIRRAHVEADTAFFLEDKALVELRVMKVTFYNAMGEVTSILTSREGTYEWDSGNMVAQTDVVVRNPVEGRRIETSILYYDRAADRIWSDAPTQMIEADGTVVEGSAFESNSRMDQADLTSARLVRPAGETQSEH
jgi:LPS export ABC transporter protein LptC